MFISEFEDEVFELEGIRILVRCKKLQHVIPYKYTRKLGDDKTVESLIKRIKSCIVHLEVEIIRGDGALVINPSTSLGTIRNSYIKK